MCLSATAHCWHWKNQTFFEMPLIFMLISKLKLALRKAYWLEEKIMELFLIVAIRKLHRRHSIHLKQKCSFCLQHGNCLSTDFKVKQQHYQIFLTCFNIMLSQKFWLEFIIKGVPFAMNKSLILVDAAVIACMQIARHENHISRISWQRWFY